MESKGNSTWQKNMETTYVAILKRVETRLEEIRAKEFKGDLNKLHEIEQHLQAINQLVGHKEQGVEDKSHGVVAVRDACKTVVFGSYLPTKTEAAALTNIANSMDIETFPESIRPKGIEIKGYVDEITAQLKRVSNVINEIAKMARSQY